jgi:hypothetical protein
MIPVELEGKGEGTAELKVRQPPRFDSNASQELLLVHLCGPNQHGGAVKRAQPLSTGFQTPKLESASEKGSLSRYSPGILFGCCMPDPSCEGGSACL